VTPVCARKTLEFAGLPVDVHVVLTTDLGMEKKPPQEQKK